MNAWRWPAVLFAGPWLSLWLAVAVAEDLLPIPPLTGRVVDQTGTLAPTDVQGLEARLSRLESEKGSQVAILLVATTRPETIEQFSIRVVDQWKLGRKGVDDGILVLVAKDDREARIEVGRGLEGVIPDAIANRIIEEELVPRFRAGDFAGGLSAAVARIAALIAGEELPAPVARPGPNQPEASGNLLMGAFILAVMLGGALRRVLGQFLGAAATGGILGFLAWILGTAFLFVVLVAVLGFFVSLFGGASPGGWTNGRRGGYGGGFGGGGFGGGGGFRGGGGGFGGGGASGRW